MEDVITLNSTHRGLVGKYVHNAGWAIFNLALVYVFYRLSCWGIAKSGKATTIKELWELSFYRYDDAYLVWGFFTFVMVVVAFIAFVYLCGVINNFYLVKRTTVFDKAQKIVTAVHYKYPYKVDTVEVRFNRVNPRVEITQSTFDRMLNTGKLRIKILTYANADTIETSWVIPHLNDPFGAKERILAGLPEYTGLKVQIEGEAQAE